MVFEGGPDEDEVRSLYIAPPFGLGERSDRMGRFRMVVARFRGLIGAPRSR